MKFLKQLLAHSVSFYGDEGETGQPSNEGSNTPQPNPPAPEPSKKTFTQDQVDQLMANHRKTLQAEVAKKAEELRLAQSQLNLTQEEKDALASRISDLESSLLTSKELADREKARLQKEKDEALSTAQSEAKAWKERHHNMLVSTALTQASVLEGQKAYNPAQIVTLFKQDTFVVESENGEFSVQMKIATKGSDGQVKVLTLSPNEAMKEIAANPAYANLFEPVGKEGLNKRIVRPSEVARTQPTSFQDYKSNREHIIGQN